MILLTTTDGRLWGVNPAAVTEVRPWSPGACTVAVWRGPSIEANTVAGAVADIVAALNAADDGAERCHYCGTAADEHEAHQPEDRAPHTFAGPDQDAHALDLAAEMLRAPTWTGDTLPELAEAAHRRHHRGHGPVTAATEVRASARASLEAGCVRRLDALVAEGTIRAWAVTDLGRAGRLVEVEYLTGARERVSRVTADGSHDHGFGWLEDFAPADFVPALDYSDTPGA